MKTPTLIRGLIATLLLLLSPLAVAEPLDLNTASANELTQLSGIGPAKAQAIVRYRTEQGAFPSVDALVNVRGIGPAILDRNRDQLIVTDLNVVTAEQ